MKMRNKLLLGALVALGLLGCDSVARLFDGPKDPPPTDTKPLFNEFNGSFQKSNFVECVADDGKDISVYVKHKGKWKPVDAYDKKKKTKKPYYVIGKTGIVFFNISPTDEYSIRIFN